MAVALETVMLPPDVAAELRAKIDGERYKSESDVIRESLVALDQRDGGFEAWLRDVVVPTAEEMKAHPELALSLEDVRESLARHHERRNQPR